MQQTILDSKIFPFSSTIKKGLLIPGLNPETESPKEKNTQKNCTSVYTKKEHVCIYNTLKGTFKPFFESPIFLES